MIPPKRYQKMSKNIFKKLFRKSQKEILYPKNHRKITKHTNQPPFIENLNAAQALICQLCRIHCVAGNCVVLKLISNTNTKVKISKAKYDLHFLKKVGTHLIM